MENTRRRGRQRRAQNIGGLFRWRSFVQVKHCSYFVWKTCCDTVVFYALFAVSNEVPEEPVLSPVSNHVFERRLVVKYINDNGTDPINGEALSVDQLLEIKGIALMSII